MKVAGDRRAERGKIVWKCTRKVVIGGKMMRRKADFPKGEAGGC